MKKIGAWRFSKNDYVLTDLENMKVMVEENGETTEYSLDGGGGVERKRLYTNQNTTIEQSTDTLFMESEIEGYQYLSFIITNTSGSYEVEEWCEIEPLKSHGGQFIISMISESKLFGRKIYRSSGAVKPSSQVYELGKTTEDRTKCIIKSVDCVKGV